MNKIFNFRTLGFLVWVTIFLSYQNCSKSISSGNIINIDPAIRNYVELFVAEGLKRKIEVSSFDLSAMILNDDEFATYVGHMDMSGNVIGYCYFEPNFGSDGNVYSSQPVIIIRKSKWSTIPELKKRDLIFHELGHCLLHRQHVNIDSVTLNSTQTNSSIMIPTLVSFTQGVNYYKNNEENLLDELFFNSKFEESITKFKLESKFSFSEERGCDISE